MGGRRGGCPFFDMREKKGWAASCFQNKTTNSGKEKGGGEVDPLFGRRGGKKKTEERQDRSSSLGSQRQNKDKGQKGKEGKKKGGSNLTEEEQKKRGK